MCWLSFTLFLFISSFILIESVPLLLLVSFDGFRYDYPQLYGPLENFSRLEQRGVHAHSMIPTFNTATYPNHYTLITGLYEETHGLISDQVYDPETHTVFQPGEKSAIQWWPQRAIWSINEGRQGARSGVIGWPQDAISVSDYQPYRNDAERSFKEIIDQILIWFTRPNKPINFGAIYFPEPDFTGHRTGPNSVQMKKKINECDKHLGYLLNEIDKNIKLKNNLHLIVTSDHGMEEINSIDQPNYLEDYVDMTKLEAFGTKTVLNIFVNSPDDIDEVFKNLSLIPNTKIYERELIPDHYHYKNNLRIGDLIIMVNPGYELHRRSSRRDIDDDLNKKHGNHGYDNQINSMRTIFYASGPQLKRNFTLPNTSALYNVDIFALMCLILNIRHCPPSNGSLANIQPFLIVPSRIFSIIDNGTRKTQDGSMSFVIYLLVLVSFILILIMAVVWSVVSFRSASIMQRTTHPDALTIAEQNQYKFTQINDIKLKQTMGDEHL